MTKKYTLLYALLLIIYPYAQSMENMENYEKFRLTRPYGTFRSNFDCLPKDVFKTHITQPLANIIATKFKHAILNHNYNRNNHAILNHNHQEKTNRNNNEPLKLISLRSKKDVVFQHHDGNYTLAPDIGRNYAMWDKTLNNIKTSYGWLDLEDDYAPQLLCVKKKEKPEIGIYSLEQNNNKTALAIVIAGKVVQNYSSILNITDHVISNDGEWLALRLENHNSIRLFSLASFTPYNISPPSNKPITTLCAAHKSPLFIACSSGGNIQLIVENYFTHNVSSHNNTIMGAEFSSDDQRFITYGENIIELSRILENELCQKYISDMSVKITTPKPIRKALFTPDDKLIIVAMTNGHLRLYDGFTGQLPKQYGATWRCEDVAAIDKQAPLILCSTKNKLVLSLDPAHHTDNTIYTFIVRKMSGRFNFLTAYNFYPNNPKAIGLTEDERSVVFIHQDNTSSILHLYDEQDVNDIDFIEQEAHIYQLCGLFQMCKHFKTEQDTSTRNSNASKLVNTMRSYIKTRKTQPQNPQG